MSGQRILFPLRDGQEPRQTKITNPQLAMACDKEVGRLDITVDDTMTVEEMEALEELFHKMLAVGMCQCLRGIDDAKEITIHQIHHQVQITLILLDERIP